MCMSMLTEVVVIVDSGLERDVAEALVAIDFGGGQHLARLSTAGAGGSKAFCSDIFAACFNYVSVEQVRDALDGFAWGWAAPTIYVRHENDDRSLVWQPTEA